MADAATKQNIYQKLAKITGEIGAIAKGGKNTEQNFAFIEYAAIAGKLRHLFAKYGVVIVPRMQEAKKQQRSEILSKFGKKGQYVLIDFYFEVVNADDPGDRFSVRWTGEAADFGDKATNKAATGALKYFLMRQFNISEKDDDPDGHTPELKPESATRPQSVAAPRVTAPPNTAKPAQAASNTAKPAQAASNTMSESQLKKMQAMFSELGIKTSEERHNYVGKVIGRTPEKTSDISRTEAAEVITQLDDDLFYLTQGPTS